MCAGEASPSNVTWEGSASEHPVYPELTSAPLTHPMIDGNSRLTEIHVTIWWQVQIDNRSHYSHGTPTQVWTDMDYILSVECEKRLLFSEAGLAGFPAPVEYRTRNYTHALYVPGMLQVNNKTAKGRPLRRLAVTHEPPRRPPTDPWHIVTEDC